MRGTRLLDLVTATQFNRRMQSGKTRPCIMTCERSNGEEVEAVVKFSQGCERRVGALVSEAIAAMFASDLELPVPEPLLVRLPQQVISRIDDIEIRRLAETSCRTTFAS